MSLIIYFINFNFDIFSFGCSRKCHIELTMSKYRMWQINPNFCKVCPWDLLIVIANDTRIGNCLRLSLNGISVICNEINSWDEDNLTSGRTSQNLRINEIRFQISNNESCAIAESFLSI